METRLGAAAKKLGLKKDEAQRSNRSHASACQTLKKVRLYDLSVEGDEVTVQLG